MVDALNPFCRNWKSQFVTSIFFILSHTNILFCLTEISIRFLDFILYFGIDAALGKCAIYGGDLRNKNTLPNYEEFGKVFLWAEKNDIY